MSKTKVSNILREYISQADKTTLERDYNSNYNDNFKITLNNNQKISIFEIVHFGMISSIMRVFFNQPIIPEMIGSGTTGYVIKLQSDNINNGITNFENTGKLFRIKKSNLLQNKIQNVAIKIQILSNKNKYWEARILREETILNKRAVEFLFFVS
jgi:hypothetical protein